MTDRPTTRYTAEQTADALACINAARWRKPLPPVPEAEAAVEVFKHYGAAGIELDDYVSFGTPQTVGDLRRAIAMIPDDTPLAVGSETIEYDAEGNVSGGQGTWVPVYDAAWRVLDESDTDHGCPPALCLWGVFDGTDEPRPLAADLEVRAALAQSTDPTTPLNRIIALAFHGGTVEEAVRIGKEAELEDGLSERLFTAARCEANGATQRNRTAEEARP